MDESTLLIEDAQLAPEVINTKSIVLLIVYLAIFIVAIYFLTKLISRRSLQRGMKKQARSKSWFAPNTKEDESLVSVADRIALDKDKTIMVVEFKGQYYLMTTTNDDINLIDKVPIPLEDIEAAAKVAEEAEKAQNEHAKSSKSESGFFIFLKQIGEKITAFLKKIFTSKKNKEESFQDELEKQLHSKKESDQK